MKLIRIAALLAIVFGTGCVTVPPVQSTVTAFHTLPASTKGTTFAIVPMEGQGGDLEYQTYQNYVRTHLVTDGWIEGDRTSAEMLVSFAYSIDQGRIATVNVPMFGQTGVSGASTAGHVDSFGNFQSTTTYSPQFGVTGYVPVSRMQYSRVVRVSIADRASVDSNNTRLVYQANILSVGTSGVIAPVMPAMLDAMFEDFPGTSGQTRHESGRVR